MKWYTENIHIFVKTGQRLTWCEIHTPWDCNAVNVPRPSCTLREMEKYSFLYKFNQMFHWFFRVLLFCGWAEACSHKIFKKTVPLGFHGKEAAVPSTDNHKYSDLKSGIQREWRVFRLIDKLWLTVLKLPVILSRCPI